MYLLLYPRVQKKGKINLPQGVIFRFIFYFLISKHTVSTRVINPKCIKISQKWIQKGLKTAFAFFRPLVSNIHPKNGIARSYEAVLSPIPTIPAKAGKTKTDPIPSVFLQTML